MWKAVFPVLAAVFAVGMGALVGGWRDLDGIDDAAQNALVFAVNHHNDGSNSKYLSRVAEVVRVQSQVVSGAKYRITVKMAKTSCAKSKTNDTCAMNSTPEQEAESYMCTFTVWSRPWRNDLQLLDQKC